MSINYTVKVSKNSDMSDSVEETFTEFPEEFVYRDAEPCTTYYCQLISDAGTSNISENRTDPCSQFTCITNVPKLEDREQHINLDYYIIEYNTSSGWSYEMIHYPSKSQQAAFNHAQIKGGNLVRLETQDKINGFIAWYNNLPNPDSAWIGMKWPGNDPGIQWFGDTFHGDGTKVDESLTKSHQKFSEYKKIISGS